MGQYYLLVNKTKKQYLDPHAFNDGLKAWEIVANGTMLKALGYLLVKSDGGGIGDLMENQLVGYWAGDEILLVGDYDSSKLYGEASENYTDISLTVLEAMQKEQGIFDEGQFTNNGYSSYMGYYIKQHPAIPFDKLSTDGRKATPAIEPVQIIIDPDELEIF